tara:strand:+ start:158 stop:547 length:390 start_codon:yes stop_codon:yes gene_type:complete
MSFRNRIVDVFEEELEARIDIMMSSYAEIISKKYQIKLASLLRDIPVMSSNPVCKGTKPDGSRCTFKSNPGGYCGKHQKQGDKIKQRTHESINGHNHGPGLRNVIGCPGCEKSASSKGLIDLDSIIHNE